MPPFDVAKLESDFSVCEEGPADECLWLAEGWL